MRSWKRRGERYAEMNEGIRIRCRLDAEDAAEFGHAVAHVYQSIAASRFRRRHIEAAAIIVEMHREFVAIERDANVRAARARVLRDVARHLAENEIDVMPKFRG